MNRRTLLSNVPVLPVAARLQTPVASPQSRPQHIFSDLRAASMYYASQAYDVAQEIDGPIFTLHSWACGFLAHPASRSTYRKFPNLFEDGIVDFTLPGLPTMRSELVERSDSLFGEDAVLSLLTSVESEDSNGALMLCLNGVLVQLLCIEPASELPAEKAVSTVKTVAAAIQSRDPDFYGRGEMNRPILLDHVASTDDVKLVFPHVRLREDHYVFRQDDGLSDFWE